MFLNVQRPIIIRSLNLQRLCRHIFKNQHRFMRFLQQQVRLCSTGTLQSQSKPEEYEDPLKLVQLPPLGYETKSQTVEHEEDNGQLFKVRYISKKKNCIGIC